MLHFSLCPSSAPCSTLTLDLLSRRPANRPRTPPCASGDGRPSRPRLLLSPHNADCVKANFVDPQTCARRHGNQNRRQCSLWSRRFQRLRLARSPEVLSQSRPALGPISSPSSPNRANSPLRPGTSQTPVADRFRGDPSPRHADRPSHPRSCRSRCRPERVTLLELGNPPGRLWIVRPRPGMMSPLGAAATCLPVKSSFTESDSLRMPSMSRQLLERK